MNARSTARHVVVMGVSGSGKTTIASRLAKRLGARFAEADDFHSPANVTKMSAGTPLSDDDRLPWLESIRDWMAARSAEGQQVVVTCSALKRAYRDLLAQAADVCFVELDVPAGVLAARMANRPGHFMPASLLASQLATLEPLEPGERGFAVNADRELDAVVHEIATRLAAMPPAPEDRYDV